MRTVGVVSIVLANVIGGTSYLGQKLALEGLPPATVTLLRNLIAMACMAPWVVWATRAARERAGADGPRGAPEAAPLRADRLRLLLAGNLGYAAPLLLGIVGLRHSTSGNGAILILLEPPAIVLFSWLLLRERVRPVQAAGLALGLLGALRIVTEQAPLADVLASEHARGNLLLAAHGLMWGLYSPLMLPVVRRRGAVGATFASMAAALVLLVPAALLETGDWSAGPALLPALGWTLALGVVASFLGTVLWSASLAVLDASTVAPFVFLQPLAGVVAGHLVLGERLTPDALLGGSVICVGVLAVLAPGLRGPGRPGRAGAADR